MREITIADGKYCSKCAFIMEHFDHKGIELDTCEVDCPGDIQCSNGNAGYYEFTGTGFEVVFKEGL